MKKSVFGIASAVVFIFPLVASASALTPAQVNAISSLLRSFGAEATTVTCVQAMLSDTIIPDMCGDFPPPGEGPGLDETAVLGMRAPDNETVPATPLPKPTAPATSSSVPSSSVPVSGPSSFSTIGPVSTAGGAAAPFAHRFTEDLGSGQNNSDVTALQRALKAEGVFTATPTGTFGPVTRAAVKAFQKDNGIQPTGTVGPITRAKLNDLFGK